MPPHCKTAVWISDYTHLLFVSPDVGFTAADVDQISSHAVPIVGGLVPLRNSATMVEWCGNGKDGGSFQKGTIHQVSFIGTSFLCIRRSALEKIRSEHPELQYANRERRRVEMAYFEETVQDQEFLSAEMLFCRRWEQLGGKLFADPNVVLKRAGRVEWPLPLQEGSPLAA